MKPYNQFSEEYNNLYFRNIIEFQKKFKEISSEDKSFVDFYPSFGIKENERTDFIIYGQAVNGWGSGFNIDEEINNEKIKFMYRYRRNGYGTVLLAGTGKPIF